MPVADTDPATALPDTFKIVPGTTGSSPAGTASGSRASRQS
jgi:hypothetical protein